MLWTCIVDIRTKQMTHDKRKAFLPKQDTLVAAQLRALAQEALDASSVRSEQTSINDGEMGPTRASMG